MKLIANQIAEVVNTAISSNSTNLVWRGVLDTQEWKILVEYNSEKKRMNIIAKRRDISGGEPE